VASSQTRSVDVPWRALQSPDYASVWLGAFISNMGTWLERIALGVYIAELTGSAGWSGLGAALLFLPAIVMAPLGGILADRFERRKFLLWGVCGQALVAGTLRLMRSLCLGSWCC
jgi:MFS family permease